MSLQGTAPPTSYIWRALWERSFLAHSAPRALCASGGHGQEGGRGAVPGLHDGTGLGSSLESATLDPCLAALSIRNFDKEIASDSGVLCTLGLAVGLNKPPRGARGQHSMLCGVRQSLQDLQNAPELSAPAFA